ncbi:MAG: DUF4329 domain-containing protein [Tyzzerella sp.]|nr:DUF4329 domain-containing protein [Tyzzerella sp.]
MLGTYISPAETGFYLTGTRYYDPEIGRFINADGYVSTGQGVLGNNMFAYCGNNPINRKDPSGQGWITALIIAVVCAVTLTGSSAKPAKPLPYKSADDAAKAFVESVYDSSRYIRHEYGTEIYSKTINGTTTYDYNTPRAGTPHSVGIGASTPAGTSFVAYAHTHPNSNSFSSKDKKVANDLKINAYVVGPNLELQRYNWLTGISCNLGVITPNILTQSEKSALVSQFRISWDSHIIEGCDFGCHTMKWPTN